MKKINVGVIGIGNLGQHHARIYYSLKEDVNLVAIADIDETKLQKFKKLYPDVYFTTDYRLILDKVDAISLAVPTSMHYEIGKEVLLNNKHLLIEKPITTRLHEAEELINIAQGKNLTLQVGHVERFNPVIQGIKNFVVEPKFIESLRLSNFDPRVADVGVVLDLMIHDIDIVLSFVKSDLTSVEAYGTKVFTDKEDIVKARLRFKNGCICDLTASRVSPAKYRKMHIFQNDSYISVDFIHQRAKIYRKKTKNPKSEQDIEFIRPKIVKDEPLKLELQHFIKAVAEKRKPVVSGEHARNALFVATEIIKQLHI
ncbi:MAG: Gfo/Idh/MocA family oxidoreductase [Endomicrobia bacterium]|nr:Gfo/Idh/MocA family oxidoreductase [Endomicrobiia bacterium]MCX7940796.1 Gfo/Idh/MocA family oxidoreductase [Endomicrobiia bacterium]MDW8056255.1 Gfo/Idh/MocA family oxidoreductase [Elusimicrobiota bacterium]